jgi:hypothetical protein
LDREDRAIETSKARWKAADRNRFIATLIETGNPATAAGAIGQMLARAYP